MALDLESLAATWRRYQAAEGELPTRDELNMAALVPWLGALLVLDCLGGESYRVRLHGSRLDGVLDGNLTGTVFGRVDAARSIWSQGQERHPLAAKPLLDAFVTAVREGRPVHVGQLVLGGHTHRNIEALALPVGKRPGSEGAAVQLIVALQRREGTIYEAGRGKARWRKWSLTRSVVAEATLPEVLGRAIFG